MNLFLILAGGLAALLLLVFIVFVSRYRRCPSDKVLVIYGKTSGGAAKCLAGGAAFVWPVFQDYSYLDLSPISIDVDLRNALSKQNIRVNVPSRFTVAISNEPGVMQNAAERLLGKTIDQIRDIAKDIIFGQLRLVVATMDIEEINSDRDKFLANVAANVGAELRKIGLSLINVNVTDIEDESGYIEALGKEAAAQAINEAKVRVAEKVREGSIGEAMARKEQRIQVSKAESEAQVGESKAEASATEGANTAKATIANSGAELRVKEAEAESAAKIGEAMARSRAIEGENQAKMAVATSDAERRIKEAETNSQATSAEKIQAAKALEEAYLAEKRAESARAQREMASKEADVIVQAEIAKRQKELNAEAEAEQIRRLAKGEADAIFLKNEAEARGMYEVLSKQAEGFQKIVDAAGGNSKDAVLMLIADKLEDLVKIQVDAIKNIKIDKVTVWENGGNNGEAEGNSTSKFISGLYKSVPPMKDLFNMAGMELPQYLGKDKQEPENGVEEK
ncbi:MAG TPA: SPFH domain-containing protein [Flavilitoribacter sp.]|nr:SPFH domain-containing protein [Flavilitoribacter sp.]HMQ85966.1 SPFH domain-containing protein [Flavilitoribacter sp.]